MQQNNEILKDGVALITGATGGLGTAFAYLLARNGYDLFLTGRSMDKLKEVRAMVKAKYRVNISIFPADLCKKNDRIALMREVSNSGAKISMLVNVAGADIQKAFKDYTQDKISFQCRANFESAIALCHFAIKQKAETLHIINISSVSGIYPMPYFAIYSATKAALTSFSVALREEVKKENVYVTAVLPGAMPTRADIKEQIKGQGLWGLLAAKSPDWVAEQALNAAYKNKAKVIPGFWNKMMRVSTAWIPSTWRMRFIAKRWSKITKDNF